jgi:protein SSXT
MLDENAAIIKTISDYQNMGKHNETVQYQWSLHRNLMYLASLADANQNLQNLLPVSY